MIENCNEKYDNIEFHQKKNSDMFDDDDEEGNIGCAQQ